MFSDLMQSILVPFLELVTSFVTVKVEYYGESPTNSIFLSISAQAYMFVQYLH